jgi:RNA ligase (TIGR02306 family)
MSENKRKLVTVRQIDNLEPIDGADAIEVATIEGWKVVVKKGEFKVGEQCVYFEIDSFLPEGNPAWQFLVDKQGREFEGVRGHRLRTIKLRGQLSQGFVLPLSACPEVSREWERLCREEPYAGGGIRDVDFSELLGIKKWEAALPAQLAGQAEGLFPSFIQKTDQERCQNLVAEIFQVTDTLTKIDTSNLTAESLDAMLEKRLLVWVDDEQGGGWMKVSRAKAQRNAEYEITMKMDGSSATFYHRDGRIGACSRNLELKINDENKDNSFVRMLFDSGLNWAMEKYGNIAVQGELMGPGIQGNREQFTDFRLYVFDIQLLDEGRKASPAERYEILTDMLNRGVNPNKIWHTPIMTGIKAGKPQFIDHLSELHLAQSFSLEELGLDSTAKLLAFADGPSIVNAVREGLVYKRLVDGFSFKTISDKFLLKGGD